MDRFDLTAGDAAAFSTWFYTWKRRWLAGERCRVVIARDNSLARVLADDDAPLPGAQTGPIQLELGDDDAV